MKDLLKVLGERWRHLDPGVTQGSSGEEIGAWFMPSGDTIIALGVGGSELYVTELHVNEDEQTFYVEDYPDAAVLLPWGMPGFPEVFEPEASLLSLVTELQAAGVTSAAPPRPSPAHDVRLSTRNLRV